MYELYCVRSFF